MARMSVADRREALVGAALAVIERDGVHAATTRAIVAEAGMSLASFHYAYASRDELLEAVVRRVVDGYSAAAETDLEVEGPMDIETLARGAISHYIELLRADPPREQGMIELSLYSIRTPGLRTVATAQYRAYHAFAESVLTRIAEVCSVRYRVDPALLARMVISMTDGLTLDYLVTRDETALEQLTDLAVTSVLHQVER